jgi:regulator of CtrA degradation
VLAFADDEAHFQCFGRIGYWRDGNEAESPAVSRVQGRILMNEPSKGSAKTVKLAERRVFSQSFKPLYQEGMGLVEQAAEYLDGKGRAEAKKLSRLAATLYAAESMRLTTRLMQVASWLLLQRAANSGEMTRDQVASEKSKVRLDTASAHDEAAGWAELPKDFLDLVTRSLRLQALVRRMDEEIYGGAIVDLPLASRRINPVSDQITLLNTAFARG